MFVNERLYSMCIAVHSVPVCGGNIHVVIYTNIKAAMYKYRATYLKGISGLY